MSIKHEKPETTAEGGTVEQSALIRPLGFKQRFYRWLRGPAMLVDGIIITLSLGFSTQLARPS